MKIIFDSEEQMINFFEDVVCPCGAFKDGADILTDKCIRGVEGTIHECVECWKKYIDIEVKENEQKS